LPLLLYRLCLFSLLFLYLLRNTKLMLLLLCFLFLIMGLTAKNKKTTEKTNINFVVFGEKLKCFLFTKIIISRLKNQTLK